MSRAHERGFSLIELLTATAITAVCSLAVALMILYGTRLGAAAREATLATALARGRLEQLRVLPRSAAERQPGGSASADVPGHFERRGRFVERWTVAAGPAGTQDITVAVATIDGRTPSARLRMLLR